MTNWYNSVTSDLSKIPDFIEHYESELEQARREVGLNGLVEKNIKELPAVTEIRFGQLQEIEGVLNFLNIQLRKIRRKHFKKYFNSIPEDSIPLINAEVEIGQIIKQPKASKASKDVSKKNRK